MQTRLFRVVAGFIWLTVATAFAQQSTPGACSVSGDVADEAGQPVSNVSVVLFPADEQKWAGGRESQLVQWAAVDAGSFKLTGFPPGEYKLAVTSEKVAESGPDVTLIKALAPRGFPLTASAGGQAQVRLFVNAELKLVRVAGSGMMVRSSGMPSPTLPAGTGTGGIRVGGPPNLPPAPRGPGAISGTVTDADGRPVAGAQIQPFIVVPRNNNALQFSPSGQSAKTDEQGVYHLTGLTPGEFVVSALASAPDYSSPGVPTISHVPPSTMQPDGRKLGYVTTYYPGTATLVRATRMTVGAAEVTGINFALQRQPVVDVSGTLTPVSGTALTAFGDVVILIPAAQANGGMAPDTRRVPIDRDGHFTFGDVPLGTYVLNFTSSGGWAHETLTVSEATAPLTIALQAPFVVKGRVEFLGETPPPTDTLLKPFRVRLAAAVTVPGARTFEVPISATGEFTFKGVPPARYILQSVTTPPWAEMSGTLGGRDTLDTPVEITADRNDAVVVLVDREAGISGTVREEGGAHDALVVVYAADSQYWTSATRRVRISRIVAGSGFSVSGLPPGRYLAFALPLSADTPAVNNALLERYQGQAQRFELLPREHRTIEIQMIR